MRLRHKKGAETDILTNPFIIQTTIRSETINRTGELCEPQNRTSELCEPHRTGELCEPSKIFNNDHPINLELGMGKGRFITELSKKHPEINFIGIEKSATIVLKAIDRLSLEITDTESSCLSSFPNLRFMCEDIENLDKVFKPHSIDKIYLNFSDPWPKKRHEVRRLTHHKFLDIYEKLLKPGSIIEFKTDNKDLFDFSLEEIKNSNFKLLEFTYDLHNDPKLNVGNIMTEYEEKFSKLGNKICKLIISSPI